MIAIRVAEYCHRAPGLLLGLFHERHAALAELAKGGFDVVALERPIEEAAYSIFLARRREQHDAGRGARDTQLYPALFIVERLIGRNLEAELLRIKLERPGLVAGGYRHEFQVGYHAKLHAVREHEYGAFFRAAVAGNAIVMVAMERFSLDAYVVDVLLPDLVGQDRRPAAFIVYLFLLRQAAKCRRDTISVSLQSVTTRTGLSKSTVQSAIRHLRRRRLLDPGVNPAVTNPVRRILRPWLRP